MKLFRKVMSGLLAGSLILSLVACGAGPGATETGDPSGNGAVGTPSASGDEIVVNVSDNVTLTSPLGSRAAMCWGSSPHARTKML